MYKPTEEPSYKQDNACDPANDPQATIGGNGHNRDGETESAATASAQPDKLLNIPKELRDRAQWCVAGEDKSPYTANERKLYRAKVNEGPWLAFEQACVIAARHNKRVGYVLTADDPYACIDLDIKDTTPAEHIKRIHNIISDFQSYTESSQSGKGYHVWVKGSVPKGRKRDSVEVYSSERFIVCTGDIVNELPIENRQDLLSSMYLQMSPEEADVELPPDQPVVDSDEVILEKIFNAGNKEHIESLWYANWEKLGYTDHSKADIALLQIIAFYTPNNEQLKRLFLLSKLGKRDKAKRADYLPRTIENVRLNEAKENYKRDKAIEHGKQIAEALLKNWRAKRSSRIKVYSPQELAKRPPMNWLVKGVLPESGLVSIYGAPSAGKSFLALDLLAYISAGDYWFGRKTKQRNVAYVAFEGMGGIPQRAQAFTKHYRPLRNFNFVEAPAINLLEDNDRKDFVAVLKEHLLTNGVICLDTLAASAPGMDENSSEGMGKLIGEVTKIQQEVGGLIILVHHSGKDDKKGLRGWSGLLGALDCAIKVTKNAEGRCCWEVTKSKDGKDGIGESFQLTTVILGHDEDGEPIRSCVVEKYENEGNNNGHSQAYEDDRVIFEIIKSQIEAGKQVSLKKLEGELKNSIPSSITNTRIRASIKRLKKEGLIYNLGNNESVRFSV